MKPIFFNGAEVTLSKKERFWYEVQLPDVEHEFQFVSSACTISCFIAENDSLMRNPFWEIAFNNIKLPVVSMQMGAHPEKSLKKALATSEKVLQGKAGLLQSTSGWKSFPNTNTEFDYSEDAKFWTKGLIAPCLLGTRYIALCGRRYGSDKSSRSIESDAMLSDLESSIGIGRFCAVEVQTTSGRLTRGIVRSVERSGDAFILDVALFHADGRTSNRIQLCRLDGPFKMAKRHLDGRWVEVTP